MNDQEKNTLIETIRRIAKELGGDHVPRHEFRRRSGISERRVQLLFGSYNALAEAAGLETRVFPQPDSPIYSNDELLKEVVKALRLPNSKMTRLFFEQHASMSSSVCERRFGGWINTLRRAGKLLDPSSDKDLIRRLKEYTEAKVSLPNDLVPPDEKIAPSTNEQTSEDFLPAPTHDVLPDASPNIYGDFINFRGLQHAPANEQGVVFLFGMICRELGYVIEMIRGGFPDCEAKRKIRDKPPRWQRVRIEFEFLSRNFRSHGHDPDQCDLIVCWQNNWPDCPIEVLELRSTLKNLRPDI